MRIKPPPGPYHVAVDGLDIELHITEEGAWHVDKNGQMVFWFWMPPGGDNPFLVSLTETGAMFLGLNEDGTAMLYTVNNETGEITEGDGSYGPA